MNTIEQDLRRLNNIANMYNKTGGEMREMWKQKWQELVKNVAILYTIHIQLIAVM